VIVPEANRACSSDRIDAAADIIRSADMVVCQLEIPVATVECALALATRYRVRTLLNPAPAQPLPRSLLSNVTVLTPNETEARVLLPGSGGEQQGCSDGWESRAARSLVAQGVPIAVITLGGRGSYVATRGFDQLIPAFPVQVEDATAAGDAFNGALAVALGEGQELAEAVVFANAAGALSTTRSGAQTSLAWRDEIEAFLKA